MCIRDRHRHRVTGPGREEHHMEIGPVDVLVVAFPGNQFNGAILPALSDLVRAGTVRLLDLLFVYKDADGAVGALELDDIAAPVSYTHLRAHETVLDLVCRLLL